MHFDIPVGQVAQRDLLYCLASDTLSFAARAMRQRKCSSILIQSENDIIGIWTEADAMKLDFSDPDLMNQTIGRHMSSPVKSIDQSVVLSEVMELFQKRQFRHCLVNFSGGQPQGLISQTDITLNLDVEYFLTLHKVQSVSEKPVKLLSDLGFHQAVQLMHRYKTEMAVVVDEGSRPVGVLTQSDIVARLALDCADQPLSAFAEKSIVTMDEEESVLSAREMLTQHNIRHLVVTKASGEVAGVVTMRKILQYIQQEYSAQLSRVFNERDHALSRSLQDLTLAERVFEHSMEGMVITDPKGSIIRVNPAFRLLTGYNDDDVVGRNMNMLSSGKHDREFYAAMWEQMTQTGSWQGEIWNRRKDGRLFLESINITAIYNDAGQISYFTSLFRDVTDLRDKEQQIRHMAYYDELTGLPNRRLLKDRLGMALASASRRNSQLAVVFLDVDHFKRINDNFGHSSGDQVLIELAERLKTATREEDTLARIGGDEFVILLSSISDYSDIAAVGRRVMHALEKPFLLADGTNTQTTLSMGASVFPDDGANVEDLLQHADTAMYSVKESGRNGLKLFKQEMAERSLRHFTLESQLRAAIDKGGLEVHYQPQFSIIDNTMVGAEALLRWAHSEQGYISPATFIPLAEEGGFVERLDYWVFEQACIQLARWRDLGLSTVPISINLSPHTLAQENLEATLKGIVAKYKLDAQMLRLEITESAFIDDMEAVIGCLQSLSCHGFDVALDDFGTGYSSLSYLTKLPLNELKIDASFVREVPGNTSSELIIGAIIAMAKSLRLTVVVEGIETQEQLDFVHTMGAEVMQGYFAARPAPAEALEARLRDYAGVELLGP
ncbi:MAG: hypothetical protein CL693_07765 [Cellvibrionaceae bacterium]|nr:hypothetical protein [Cellvibrionaceae bacterium]|tara:strand:- start:1581 stop:4097 length:2517 start_codon:yes stop_codon:yes gene_type:complete